MLNIIHCSDVFIQHARLKEYSDIFEIFFTKIRLINPDFIIICGNLLNDRSASNVKDITILTEFLTIAASICRVIIISGDHDILEINELDNLEIVTSLIPNIDYLRDFKSINYKNYTLNFYTKLDMQLQDGINIMIFHGEIFGSENVYYSNTKIHMFDKFDFTFCGGNKKMQLLNDHLAYCGQLIQQNILEPHSKYGFLHWSILTKDKYNVIFREIFNEYGYLRYNLSINAGKVEYLDLREPKHPYYWDIKIESNDMYNNLEDVIKYTNFSVFLRDKIKLFGKPQQVIYKTLDNNTPTQISYIDIIKKLLEKSPLVEEVCKKHMEYYGDKNPSYNRIKLKLQMLQFSNIYCFGENCSINFQPFINIVSGIIAGNEMGKSSIINIILIAFFGDAVISEKTREIIRIGTAKGHIKITFSSNKYTYDIERIFWKTGKTQCIFKKHSSKNTTILEESMIKIIVGEPECVLNTSIIKQIAEYDLITANSTERKNIFAKSLRIADFSEIEKRVKKEMKICLNNIKMLTIKDEICDITSLYSESEILKQQLSQMQDYNDSVKRIKEIRTRIQDIDICLSSFPDINGNTCKIEYDLETLFNIKLQYENITQILAEMPQLENEYAEKSEIMHNLSGDAEKLIKNREIIKKSHIFTFLAKYNYNTSCEQCSKLLEFKNILSNVLQNELKVSTSCLERENAYLIVGNIKHLLKKDCDSLEIKIKKRKSIIDICNKYNEKSINDQLFTYKSQLLRERSDLDAEYLNLNTNNIEFYHERRIMISTKLENINSHIAKTEKLINTIHENNRKIELIETEYKILKEYLTVIKPTGILNYLLSLQIEKINGIVNSILRSCDKTFTGSVKIITDSMYKIYYSNDSINYHLASLTSGYRRFVINLSVKMALWQVTNAPVFDCLIIDEKISSCDTHKLKNVMEFIENIAYNENLPSLVFLVSHLDYVKAKMQKFLTITKTENGHIVRNDIHELRVESEKLEGKYYCEFCDIFISILYKSRHLESKRHKLNII